MAHIYEGSVTKTTGAAAGPIATIATSSSLRAEIREIGIFATTAVAGEIGVGRPAAAGTGSVTSVTPQPLDAADVAGVQFLVTSYATSQPTVPAVPFRRAQIAGVVGAGLVFVWQPGELIIPVSSSIVVWQYSALAVTYDVYVKLVQ
jgi:hypothetical protein